MKFFVDMPVSPILAAWLQEQGHDAIHASEVKMESATDPEILTRSGKEQRIIITADLDYPRLLALAHTEGPGLILFRGGNFGDQEMLALLKHAMETVPLAELPNSIVVIEKGRIRRRRLPL